MKVTLIQMDVAWGDPGTNRKTAERAIFSAEKSDLYVLPEMWSTGYNVEPEGVAESESGETLEWMKRIVAKLDAAVAGSIAFQCEDGTYRNRLYFVTPPDPLTSSKGNNGQSSTCNIQWYDKHHLFSYGGEDVHYTPGEKRVNVEWRGVRYRLCTCYDLRFPFWLRNKDDYDALICVASWPAVRMHAWLVLLCARAIENQCYVLGVNRVGTDPVCEYSGGTSFVDPYGMPTTCPEGKSAVLTQTMDLKHLRHFRDKFPVLKEMDKRD